MIKKILKRLGIFLFVLIAIAFAAPFIFKSQIVSFVKKEINKNINAKVDFKDVDISFFRHFPKVAVAVEDLQVIGSGVFQYDTLVSAKSLDAAVNIMSVIKGKDMTIYSVNVESPRVHAIVNKDGLVNWDIVKVDSTVKPDTESKPFKMELQSYKISNAYISYVDEVGGVGTEIYELDHEGSGDFTSDVFTLKTATVADALTVTYGGIPYLSKVKLVADADVQVDNKNAVYSFNTEKISVNDLAIAVKGSVKDLLEKGYNMDIQFKSPSTDFKNILSLVPAIYKNDFSKIKTSGTALFSGFVRGIYNDTSIPAYNVDMEVKEGSFQYPDLPKPLQHINVKANVNNPDGQTDNTVINVQTGHIEMDGEPFDFRLLVKKPISNMFVDAAAKGKLDLSKVSQFVKLEKGTSLAGLLNADVAVKGNVTDIEQQKFDQFSASGTAALTNFLYKATDYPTGVKINNLQTAFMPQKILISAINGQYLGTNFNGSGEVNNLLNYMLQSKPLKAKFDIKSDNVDLNKFMGTSTDTTAKAGAATGAFVVPANLDVILTTSVGNVHYDKLDMQNVSGSLNINDETVSLNDVKANALDGTVGVSGSYSTKASKTKPDISLNYSVDKVDVQKTFNAFNTVQQLMPIGKFIAGKLTSQLSMNGKLGDNMMPDLSTLTGKGNLLLIEGFLSKFAPLDKIASTLNVKSLEQISLKEIKNYFEFANGKMLVKPFPVKVNTIDMEIGGMQGFDQTMDYIIAMKVPRALMGDKGNQLVDGLVSKVNAKGIPVKVGDVVNLNLQLGGTFKSPTIKTDLKQSAVNLADQLKQQAVDFAKAKIDSTKQAVTSAVKDTIASVKKQALEAAKQELAKQLLGGNKSKDSTNPTKPKPQESVKGLLNNILKKKKDTTAKP